MLASAAPAALRCARARAASLARGAADEHDLGAVRGAGERDGAADAVRSRR